VGPLVIAYSCLVRDGADRLQAGLVEPRDPALLDLVDGRRVEVVKSFPSPPYDGHEVGPHEEVEMPCRRLARHVHAFAQLARRPAVVLAQTVKQGSSGGVGQRFEDRVHRSRFEAHTPIMQVITCIMSTASRLRPDPTLIIKAIPGGCRPVSAFVRRPTDDVTRVRIRAVWSGPRNRFDPDASQVWADDIAPRRIVDHTAVTATVANTLSSSQASSPTPRTLTASWARSSTAGEPAGTT